MEGYSQLKVQPNASSNCKLRKLIISNDTTEDININA